MTKRFWVISAAILVPAIAIAAANTTVFDNIRDNGLPTGNVVFTDANKVLVGGAFSGDVASSGSTLTIQTGAVTNSKIAAAAGISRNKLQALAANSIVFTDPNGFDVAGYLSGDIALSGSTATIQPGVVTNAKQAVMANSTIKCNVSGGSASPSDCAITTLSPILGALLAVNNLSDVQNAVTSRQNLGFPNIATGSVLFGSGSTLPSVDSNFVWDNTNKRLGLGINTPSAMLELAVPSANLGTTRGIKFTNSSAENFLIYQGTASDLRITDPNQGYGAIIAASNQGRVTLGGAAFGHPDATVLMQNQTGITGIPTLGFKKITSQTADFMTMYNTDEATILANIDINGVASVQKIKVGPAVGAGATLVDGNGSGIYTGSTIVSPPCVALTPGATVNIDWSLGNCFTLAMNANTALTMSKRVAGQMITVRVTDPAAYTLTFPNTAGSGTSVLWPGSTIPTQTTAGHTDIYTTFFDGTNMYGATPTQNY